MFISQTLTLIFFRFTNLDIISKKVQLKESHHFMKNFVKFTVNSKKIFLKNLVISQLNDEKELNQDSEQQAPNLKDCQSSTCHSIERLLNANDNLESQNLVIDETNTQPKEHYVIIDLQFIVECVFISILDSDGKFFKLKFKKFK